MINIEEIISEKFLETPLKNFESEKLHSQIQERIKKFEKTLTEKQLAEFRQIEDEKAYYGTVRADELIHFVLEFLRSILTYPNKK